MLMKSNFNKFLTLLAVLLFGVGSVWAVDPIENVGTYSTQVISADGLTSTWTFPLPSSQVKVPTGETEENDVIYAPSASGKMKFTSSNQFSWSGTSSGYFYVPAGAAGTISMTVKSSSDSRYLQLYVAGSAAADSKRLWSKYNATPTSDGKKGPQSFSFTSSDLTTKGTKTYLHFKDNNTEMKIATISITLTTGNYRNDLSSYTITYDKNGGDGTMDNSTNTVSACTFTAPTGKEFKEWNTQADGLGDTWAVGATATSDLDLFAIWQTHTASNNANLSALSVTGGTLNETFDPATTAYTMTLPFYASMPAVGDVTATKDDANAADPVVSISGNVITIACEAEDNTPKSYTITVTIDAAPAASSSLNFEQNVLDNTKSWDVVTALTAANIVTDGRNGLDSLNDGKTARNYPYLGLKFKKAGADIIKIVVPADNALNVKFGNVGVALTTTVNGVAGAGVAKASSGTFHLDAAAYVREVVFHSSENQTVTLQQVKIGADFDPITLPFLVTYDAGDGSKGTCAKASEIWTGTALILPAVTPVSGWNFDGWNDGVNDYAAGDPYTPTTNATLTAQYSAVASGTDLDALTYTIGAGSPVAVGYSAGTFTYNIELPYAVYPTITVAATPVSGASIKDDATKVLTVSSLPGTATFTVTDGVADQLYTVNFSRLPKDGVCLVKIEPTSQTKGTQTGLYHDGDELTINLSSGMNLGGSGKYIGVKATENFQEGDVLHLDLNTKPNTTGSVQIILYADNAAGTELWATGVEGSIADDYYLTLPAAVNGHKELYIVRTDGNKWNGGPTIMEVLRPMNPMLTAMTIDGRTVTINEAAKTATVTIPYEADLAALTIVDEVVWNAPAASDAKVVTSNSGNWVIGDNTYVLTDKDGDATTYTITVARDVLKHTVSFNTHGGSAVASEEVEHNGYLAAAPAAPTKDDYTFQYWSEAEDGAEVDVTTVQIDEDKTFHAVWAADGAIKLLDGSTVNHTNFTTGVTASTVNFDDADHNCAVWGGTQGSISGTNALGKIVQYNATTNQTKVKVKLYSTNSGAKEVYLHKILEGETTAVVETIAVASKTPVETEYYAFNNDANRSIYITTNSTDVRILQVKVIDDGATLLKRAGQAGYEVNLNKGRVVAYSGTEIEFEGLTFTTSSNYGVINSTELQIKTPLSFSIAAPLTLTVTTNSAKYYVSQNSAEDGTTATAITAAGTETFDLTATGTWYIVPSTTSAVKLTNIAFSAPKCEQPTITTQPATKIDFPAGDLTATVVAEVTDGGTLSYQWYNASDDSEVAGATNATLTTTTEGTYYVIVTNSLADHADNFIKSDNATLGYIDLTDATLSALSYGGTSITLSDGVYEYDVNLAEGTVDVPLLAATATMAAYGATAVPTDAVAFVSYEATSTVLVTAADGLTQQTYTVNFHVDHMIAALVDVTGDMTWDFSKANDGTAATSSMCTDAILANVAGIVNNANFESDNIMATANKFKEGKLQASMIKFHTTVNGIMTVIFSNTGSKTTERYLVVNGVKTEAGSKTETAVTYTCFVPAGDVVLTVVDGDGNMLNFTSIDFVAKATPDYTRTAMLGNGVMGTICVPNNVPAGQTADATFYELVGKNDAGKIVFEQITSGALEAGKPYVFVAKGDNLELYYGSEHVDDPVNANGMYGTFTDITLPDDVPAVENLNDIYYFAQKALWSCTDLTSLSIPANRAYVKLSEIPSAMAPAPGRIRMTLNVNGAPQVTTGMEEITNDQSQMANKVIIDGRLFILRGEKLYDATGKLVK